jgi:hypothetical protein
MGVLLIKIQIMLIKVKRKEGMTSFRGLEI